MIKRKTLKTEQQNKKTIDIDQFPIFKVLETINDEDRKISAAVKKALPEIEQVVGLAKSSLLHGGRVFYIGAGTSGRLGVLDASECPPTFGVDNNVIIGIIAGGDTAIRNSIEGAEDNLNQAWVDLEKYNIKECKSVINNFINNFEYFLEDENKLIYKPAFFCKGNLIWGATANILTELLVKI